MTPEPTEPETVDTGALDMNLMRQMAQLQQRKKEQDAALKETKAEIAAIQEVCMTAMVNAGVERLPMTFEDADGVTHSLTLYVHTQLWARPVGGSEGRAAVVEVLREEGMDDFLKTDFNVQQLSAFARECDAGTMDMPERLEAVLDLTNTVEIRARAR